MAAYERHGGNVIAVEEVPPAETHHYGIVGVGADHGATFEITRMVEKPKPGTAPSNLIISGRYILQPEIFQILELIEKGAGGEIQLTDGMIQLARTQSFHGVRFDGSTYDCGSRLGFLTANLAFALGTAGDLAPRASRRNCAGSALRGPRGATDRQPAAASPPPGQFSNRAAG